MNSRRSLREWRVALGREDYCPYIGPRPQTAADPGRMLIGREREIERVNRAVVNRSLVIFDGYSGVGKSSLLQNGLLRRLDQSGFAVLVCNRWGEIPPREQWSEAIVEQFILARIKRTHRDLSRRSAQGDDGVLRLRPPAGTSGVVGPTIDDLDAGGLCANLDRIYKETGAVLILDQFEELLRIAPEFGEIVVNWVVDAIHRFSTRIVISMRTDSLHLLELRGVRAFSMDRVHLPEITDEDAIRAVIETRLDRDDTSKDVAPEPSVDRRATDELVEHWRTRKRLLDLQATLYGLFFRARARREASEGARPRSSSIIIEAEDAGTLVDEARAANVHPFVYQLRESVGLKIDHAEAASRTLGFDDYLVCGTRELVRRIVPNLSSGGFKVQIYESELATRVLEREMQTLEGSIALEWDREPRERPVGDVARDAYQQLFEQLRACGEPGTGFDLLTLPWWEVDALRSRIPSTPRRVEVTAGPMMHATASATLFEEIRRFAFAVEWLEATGIVRKDDNGLIALIHDQSGDALKRWADRYPASAAQALRRITAARGLHFVWREGPVGGDRAAFRIFANVNWRECRISATFRNAVFVNCDFTWSRFENCTFEGVTFVNCLLDDANFENCTLVGANRPERLSRTERGEVRVAPSFTVGATDADVADFNPYLKAVADAPFCAEFFSDTSGTAARPSVPGEYQDKLVLAHFAAPDDAETKRGRPAKTVRLSSGGLTMVGGRLCFLTLYRCKAESAESSFAFHHVAGSGLDIVEQYGGSIDIHDGVVRGVSVTREADSASDRRQKVTLTVSESIVANVCFAGGLSGTARFENCMVLMLINASENSPHGFLVDLKDCRYQFLVNTSQPEGSEDSVHVEPSKRFFSRVEGSESRFAAANLRDLARTLEAMDYRSRPEEWEREQRRRRAEKRGEAAD